MESFLLDLYDIANSTTNNIRVSNDRIIVMPKTGVIGKVGRYYGKNYYDDNNINEVADIITKLLPYKHIDMLGNEIIIK